MGYNAGLSFIMWKLRLSGYITSWMAHNWLAIQPSTCVIILLWLGSVTLLQLWVTESPRQIDVWSIIQKGAYWTGQRGAGMYLITSLRGTIKAHITDTAHPHCLVLSSQWVRLEHPCPLAIGEVQIHTFLPKLLAQNVNMFPKCNVVSISSSD